MKNSIFITGSSGFVGSNLQHFLSGNFEITSYKRDTKLFIEQAILIHLAGKAHDLKNTPAAHEYYQVNTELTQRVFDAFLASDAKKPFPIQ